MSMLPRYLIGRAAAAPDDPEGGPIYILDQSATPRLLVRLDPDVSAAEVQRAADAPDPESVTPGDALMLRVWSPDGTPTFEDVADRLKETIALYRSEVEPGETEAALPRRWGAVVLGSLEPLLHGVPTGQAGLPALVFDGAFRELPNKWSGVALPGPNCLQFHLAANPNAKRTRFTPDGCWPDRPLTAEDEACGDQAARLAWQEHHAA